MMDTYSQMPILISIPIQLLIAEQSKKSENHLFDTSVVIIFSISDKHAVKITHIAPTSVTIQKCLKLFAQINLFYSVIISTKIKAAVRYVHQNKKKQYDLYDIIYYCNNIIL